MFGGTLEGQTAREGITTMAKKQEVYDGYLSSHFFQLLEGKWIILPNAFVYRHS